MSLSKPFKALQKRLSELHLHLLPSRFSATGSYNDRVQDRARGYRLLAHAEIEAYLEEISKTVVIARISEWRKTRTPSNLLIAFLACYHSGWVEYDDKNNAMIIKHAKSRKKIQDAVKDIVDQALKQFIYQLGKNHGIREKNLKTLVLPTGVDLCDLDAAWIVDIDDFGKLRGVIAHNSKSTTGSINPQDEYNRVKNLIIGLKALDKKMSAVI